MFYTFTSISCVQILGIEHELQDVTLWIFFYTNPLCKSKEEKKTAWLIKKCKAKDDSNTQLMGFASEPITMIYLFFCLFSCMKRVRKIQRKSYVYSLRLFIFFLAVVWFGNQFRRFFFFYSFNNVINDGIALLSVLSFDFLAATWFRVIKIYDLIAQQSVYLYHFSNWTRKRVRREKEDWIYLKQKTYRYAWIEFKVVFEDEVD